MGTANLDEIVENYSQSVNQIFRGNTIEGIGNFFQSSANLVTFGAVDKPGGFDNPPEDEELEKQKGPPGLTDPAVIEAKARAATRYGSGGRASTILTSATASTSPNLSRRTLLGA